MTRDTALQILRKYVTNDKIIKHSLATEAVMSALAARVGADILEWGITGLLHDADYDRAKGHPELHSLELFKLEPNSIPTPVQHAIQAHNILYTNVRPVSMLDWALTCCDDLTLFIMAAAQKQKEKALASLTPEIILELLNNKGFAKGAKRDMILLCEEKLGIKLNDFIAINLKAMQGIHEQLGI